MLSCGNKLGMPGAYVRSDTMSKGGGLSGGPQDPGKEFCFYV